MSDEIKWLQLKDWVRGLQANHPFPGIGYVRCDSRQQLRDLQAAQSFLVIIVQGNKRVVNQTDQLQVNSKHAMAFPAHADFSIINTPEEGAFYALVLQFSPDQLQGVQGSHGQLVQQALASKTTFQPFKVSGSLLSSLLHLLDALHGELDSTLLMHRYNEVLLALLLSGQGGCLFVQPQAKWRDKVSQLISLDPANNWSLESMSERLHVSETTLRRRLREEGVGFRQVLADTRLGHGLYLLQSGLERRPISDVSERCGYQSVSSFSAQFKSRFGMLPSQLQKSVI
ncbi:AraC family transcriptional regulator [Motilimonas eburnea]|uniref:AraC family transcriptional regulator n=1 Tax=Motilimonas eburnea TaxID=1737488 RepID=UPI001E469551|nr:helix-turn-helix domain-containing protein [Motilimonas eburnea]MCE2569875.1 AraC family transcriptional regulator [Motilimonas eburnea]